MAETVKQYHQHQSLNQYFFDSIGPGEFAYYNEEWWDECRSSSDQSKFSTDFFERVLVQLETKAVSDDTLLTYMVPWHDMNDFYIHLDKKPKPWEHRIALYIAYLVMKKTQDNTIRSYISGIKYILRLLGVQLDNNSCQFNALIKAARLRNPRKVKMRLPIKLRLTNRLIREVDKIKCLANQPYLRRLYKAMFISAYYGLLRISEIAGKHAIKSKDVHLSRGKRKVQFRFWTTKTLKKGSWPQDVKMEGLTDCKSCYPKSKKRTDSVWLCPLHLLLDYQAHRETTHGAENFFIFKSGLQVKPHHFRNMLKKLIRNIGLNCAAYNTHSFRSGRSCDLRRLGYSLSDLKFYGRWRSNVVYKYLLD